MPECSSLIYIKLGPNGNFYIQHGVEKKVLDRKMYLWNLIGPIFEDEGQNQLSTEEAMVDFHLKI